MFGFTLRSSSSLMQATAVALMLSVLAPASHAASMNRHTPANSGPVAAEPHARALYPSAGIDRDSSDDPNRCIGGYRWIQRFDDANQTPAQSEVPVRCR